MRNNAVISGKISVIVCDPCPLIAAGLQKNFQDDTKIHIQGEASDLRALSHRVASEPVDIALVDWSAIAWHDHESIKTLHEVTCHALLVILGMTETTRDRKRALEFGARGIVSKVSNTSQIKKALCRVFEGGIWLERSAAETLLDHVFSPPAGPQHELQRIELLTRREREIISLVCRSLRNKEIASALEISESTIWHHLTSIFSKLQVSDRLALVTFALRHNLNSFVDGASTPAACRRSPGITHTAKRPSRYHDSPRRPQEEIAMGARRPHSSHGSALPPKYGDPLPSDESGRITELS